MRVILASLAMAAAMVGIAPAVASADVTCKVVNGEKICWGGDGYSDDRYRQNHGYN